MPTPLPLRSLRLGSAQAVGQLRELWEALDDLDAHCWVLDAAGTSLTEPTRRLGLGTSGPPLRGSRFDLSSPQRRHCGMYIVIAAGNHCSLQITLDPKAPRAFPTLRFMGSDAALAPLKAALNRNMPRW